MLPRPPFRPLRPLLLTDALVLSLSLRSLRIRLKLNPTSPLKHGKVWGVYHWNHRQIGKETKIGGAHKKQWMLDAEQSPDLTPDQLRSMLKTTPMAASQQ